MGCQYYPARFTSVTRCRLRSACWGNMWCGCWPGKCCRALAIDRALNTADLAGEELFVCTSPADAGLPEVTPPHYTMHTGKRIGIDYAEEAADFPWRFWLEREDG